MATQDARLLGNGGHLKSGIFNKNIYVKIY
jgi:hypothetical protein